MLPLAALGLLTLPAQAQQLAPLTVEKIMRDPAQWLGTSPSTTYWAEDGKTIYFNWNPEKARRDSLYRLAPSGGTPRKVSLAEQRTLPAPGGEYDRRFTRRVFEKEGDIYLQDLKTQRVRRVTNTAERETDPQFALLDQLVSYTRGGNLFTWDPATGETVQRTDFRKGPKPGPAALDKSDKFLKAQQLALFEVLRGKEQDAQARQRVQKALARLRPKAIYLGTQTVRSLRLAPRWALRHLHPGAGTLRRKSSPGT